MLPTLHWWVLNNSFRHQEENGQKRNHCQWWNREKNIRFGLWIRIIHFSNLFFALCYVDDFFHTILCLPSFLALNRRVSISIRALGSILQDTGSFLPWAKSHCDLWQPVPCLISICPRIHASWGADRGDLGMRLSVASVQKTCNCCKFANIVTYKPVLIWSSRISIVEPAWWWNTFEQLAL